jgi:transcriptional antiterminator RfaH
MDWWHIVRSTPRGEPRALHFLDLFGFTAYCPSIRSGTRRGPKSQPLFPSYVFVGFDEACQRRSVWGIPGVGRLIMSGDQPARLSSSVIDEIRAREYDGLVQLPPPPPRFRPNDPVRFVRGPFGGLQGLYLGQNGHERVRILFEWLSRSVEVAVPERDVEAV